MVYNWDKKRPKKPTSDPMLIDLRRALSRDNRSVHAKANVSGLSSATIRNILDGTTRYPQSLTLQMAWSMLGYDMVPVKKSHLTR